MLRLTHAKMRLLFTTFLVVKCFLHGSATFALVRAPASEATSSSSIDRAGYGTHLREPSRHFSLPAALDPLTDLEDQSDETRSGLSRRAMLLSVADEYARWTHIPYVWGGNKVGSPSECESCRQCLKTQKSRSLQRRHRACTACRQCGLDCSHFVNKIYRDAGLGFPYASTRVLRRASAQTIRQQYGLVDVGRDVRRARPGDLILKDKHIVMLIQMRDGRKGDILHVSRAFSRGRVGGLQLVTDTDVQTFSGRTLRIFRHQKIVEEEMKNAPMEPAPAARQVATNIASLDLDWKSRLGLLVRHDRPTSQTPWRPVL